MIINRVSIFNVVNSIKTNLSLLDSFGLINGSWTLVSHGCKIPDT